MATATQHVVNGQVDTQTTKRDFRQEVTDSIVQMLEQGVAPWQKPWEPAAGAFEMPVNPTTEKSYRGGNAIHLMATALRKGYDDPRWMTYRQAAENGWQVRKGEKGSQIEFWEIRDRSADSHTSDPSEDRSQSSKSKSLEERRLIHRVYTVFNAKQIDVFQNVKRSTTPRSKQCRQVNRSCRTQLPASHMIKRIVPSTIVVTTAFICRRGAVSRVRRHTMGPRCASWRIGLAIPLV
jgi:antirestriction protein ArdC